jgi:hypothetical protein
VLGVPFLTRWTCSTAPVADGARAVAAAKLTATHGSSTFEELIAGGDAQGTARSRGMRARGGPVVLPGAGASNAGAERKGISRCDGASSRGSEPTPHAQPRFN